MINEIKVEDLIYLAGVTDADGSIIAQFIWHNDYNKKNQWEIRTTFQITQKSTRVDFLNEILKIIGVGRVSNRSGGLMSDFILQEPANLIQLLIALKPYLRLKKKQAELVIEIIQKRELIQNKPKTEKHSKESIQQFIDICPLVDQVSNLNDSKSRVNTAKNVITNLKAIHNL